MQVQVQVQVQGQVHQPQLTGPVRQQPQVQVQANFRSADQKLNRKKHHKQVMQVHLQQVKKVEQVMCQMDSHLQHYGETCQSMYTWKVVSRQGSSC